MDTVCEDSMAIAMMKIGGVGCIHRFVDIDLQCEFVKNVADFRDINLDQEEWLTECDSIPIMAAVGVKDDFLERAQELVKAGANVLLIDVAHGFHTNVAHAALALRKNLSQNVNIIVGNIVTEDAAEYFYDMEVDGLRVGIGGGAVCRTRTRTGFGVPNVTAIMDCVKGSRGRCAIIADGGIRNSGDMVKAFAVGANTVMIGSLLAGTEETPGKIKDIHGKKYKTYRGSASAEIKLEKTGVARHVEGESVNVKYKGPVANVLQDLIDGIKSGLSYNGSVRLSMFNPKIISVTNAGIAESKTIKGDI
jgi:IMP dehydrogenase